MLLEWKVTVALMGLFFVFWQPLLRSDFPAIEGKRDAAHVWVLSGLRLF
jgi:hypothetical protein